MPKNTTITPEEAREAVTALRKFWKAGKRSLGRLRRIQRQKPDAYCYGGKQEYLKSEAVKAGYKHDTMKKAWRIAQEYNQEAIEELCGFVKLHGARFGPTHPLRLVTVKNRPRRDALALKAVKGRWGVTRLETAILGLHRRRPEVSRKPRVPKGPAQLWLVLALQRS